MSTEKTLNNPFVISGYDGPEYFCDREEETETMIRRLTGGMNMTLISPRRMGKTGLIKHVFRKIQEQDKEAICLYFDIFSTNNANDFANTLGAALSEDIFDFEKPMLQKIKDLVGTMRPVMTFDPLTGAPSVSVNMQYNSGITTGTSTIENTLEMLESLGKDVFVAIDEFQQITEYPEKGLEAKLRSQIQFLRNVRFIFSGSKMHLMSEMFYSPKRPFYQSTGTMSLNPIGKDSYFNFANNFFKKKGGSIDEKVFGELYDSLHGVTWYMQCVLRQLYQDYDKVDSNEQLNDVISQVVDAQSAQYEMLAQFLTTNQFDLLKAIAKEVIVEKPTSIEFIQKYYLPTPSSVKAALKTLTDRELVYRTKEGYSVYDLFMASWLRKQ